jgi:hypothetical protein
MALNETLFIFTTEWIFEDEDTNYLFNKTRKVQANGVYRLKADNLLVFGKEPLERGILDKQEFFGQLIKDVRKDLSKDEAKRIKEIKLFLHRYELNLPNNILFECLCDKVMNTNAEELFGKLNLAFGNAYHLLTKDNYSEKQMSVEFVGYQQEPDNMVYTALCKCGNNPQKALARLIEKLNYQHTKKK